MDYNGWPMGRPVWACTDSPAQEVLKEWGMGGIRVAHPRGRAALEALLQLERRRAALTECQHTANVDPCK